MEQHLQSIKSLFVESWNIYAGRIKTFLGIGLIPFVVVLIGFLVSASEHFQGLTFIFAFFGIILYVLYFLALVHAVHTGSGVRDAYRVAGQKFWSYLWVAALTNTIVVGGLFLGVIPGIIFSVWFSFGVFVLIIEGRRGLEALLVSREYLRGHFWSFLGRTLLMVFIVAIAQIAVTAPASLFENEFAESIAELMAQLFIIPFTVVFLHRIYSDLRRLKPGMESAAPTGSRTPFIVIGMLGIILPIVLIAVLGVAAVIAFLQGISGAGV